MRQTPPTPSRASFSFPHFLSAQNVKLAFYHPSLELPFCEPTPAFIFSTILLLHFLFLLRKSKGIRLFYSRLCASTDRNKKGITASFLFLCFPLSISHHDAPPSAIQPLTSHIWRHAFSSNNQTTPGEPGILGGPPRPPDLRPLTFPSPPSVIPLYQSRARTRLRAHDRPSC